MILTRTEFMTRLAASCLGGVLLVAGLLKASARFSALYHFGAVDASEFVTNSLLLALATVEVVVAIVLAQRPFSLHAWRLAFVMFAGFFLVALLQARAGRQVCDCFGAVLVKPHYTAIFDLMAAAICGAVLLFLRQATTERPRETATRLMVASTIAFVLAFYGLLILRESQLGDARYGITPVVAELQFAPNSSKQLWMSGSALLASRGGQSVRVVGCVQNCALQTSRELPFEITPTTFTRLPLSIRRPTKAQVGLVPLTLFVEVRGTLEKLTLPLLTPQLSE